MTDQGEAHRSRRLRKYEAAALPALRCEGPPALDLISPFGPMIGRGVAPPSLLERLNGYAAGHVSPTASTEFLIPPDLALGDGLTIGRSLETLVARWAQAVDGAPPGRVRIETIWIVSQYADSASPMHFHSGDASGVIYLATPEIVAEAEEEAKTYISGRRAGYLNFLIGGKQRFSKSLFSVKPRLGDMWVFPGWLLHGVEPFRGSGERRSLAFNAYVDD